ncbi:vacuolar protein sorting-associated protein 13 [Gautieria morchelliformis]|nr:vacuolar protein sorting-associated protein 13 [Gautieria morchelliformis]
MWSWTDPVRDVLQAFLNRICAPYIENFDSEKLNYGLTAGQLALRNLRLKKSALDKFRLPVDVLEGHLGKLTLSIPWTSLSSKPVEILIEDIYLLIVPASNAKVDPEDDERRAQAVKAEKLKNSELFGMKGQTDESSAHTQGFVASLVTKIVNNLQVTVKNIHIRYEDDMSCPGHPFAAGVTLAGFTAKSVDENWIPTFIQSSALSIHKLARLESLAVYFDTDSPSISGLPVEEAIEKFTSLISSDGHTPEHQFILKPVTGEGRITLNKAVNEKTPKTNIQLLFDEIGFALDDHQYRDVISLVDMYHFYLRRYQYRQFAPNQDQLSQNRARALIQFAGKTILKEIHERNRKYTLSYVKEVGNHRRSYMALYKKKLSNQLTPDETSSLEALEYELSYEDIQLYRFLARRQLREDIKAGKFKKEHQEQKAASHQESTGSWGLGWLIGYGTVDEDGANGDPGISGNLWNMTDEQQRQLYDAVDFHQDSIDNESGELPPDALKLRVAAQLDRGSLTLKTKPHGAKGVDIMSIVFDQFKADTVQRPNNLEAVVALRGFRVFDGTTTGSAYPQIVRVKEGQSRVSPKKAHPPADHREDGASDEDSFLYMKFEHKPLDERADSALTVRLRYMEIIYHKGYVEAIYNFLRPPQSQLESLEALLASGVASKTLDGIRQETRAGLEYAMETHKTIDLKMDLQAPIIILPEDVTTEHGRHIVLDAGHIAIESDLAAKDARHELDEKLNQTYDLDDYKRLESYMYDRFSLKFEAAQLLLGPDLRSCLQALESSEAKGSLHIVERINIELLVQNSILPSRAKLPRVIKVPRFKASGKLHALQVNLSDSKYKAIMRFIDIAIPTFGDKEVTSQSVVTAGPRAGRNPAFPFPPGIFGSDPNSKYNLKDEVDEDPLDGEEEFVDAEDSTAQDNQRQQTFVLDFQVDALQAFVSKTNTNGIETPLGDLRLERFRLGCSVEDLKITVDVTLRSLRMLLMQPDGHHIPLLSSTEDKSVPEGELLSVAYARVQPEHADYMPIQEGFDQNIKILLSTFIFHAAPEPVILLYDFIMTTFVPEKSASTSPLVSAPKEERDTRQEGEQQATIRPSKIRVTVNLASVQGMYMFAMECNYLTFFIVLLVNDASHLATLALSTASISVKLLGNVLRVNGTLGTLSLTDESELRTRSASFKKLLSIEGDHLANFTYQTFDSADESTFRGVNSMVTLKSGALRFTFLEGPLRDIYRFVIKFAKLKGLYDAAAQAAAQRASEIQRMQFDVSVQSPIMVFPRSPADSNDTLIMKLGEIAAHNSFEGIRTKTGASLKGIQLTSQVYYGDNVSRMKIIDDVEIIADVMQTGDLDRTVQIKVSDVKLHVTQGQYRFIMQLADSIPKVLGVTLEAESESQSLQPATHPAISPSAQPTLAESTAVDLQPEIEPAGRIWTSMDLVLTVDSVRLHLYDGAAILESDMKTRGITRVALTDSSLRYKHLSDGAAEAELVIKSFTMSNTRPSSTRFREIIPAAQHNRNQFMVLYTTAGGTNPSSLAIVTVNSPKIIFSVDPVFALLDFFSSASESESSMALDATSIHTVAKKGPTDVTREPNSIDFRIDLHDVTISVLENDTIAETQAIELSVKQVLISQQGILALTINRLGMSLLRMDQPSDGVRILDDLDLTLSMDNRKLSAQQMSSIELTLQPVVFRVSYRDINLITAIVNKAIGLLTKSRSSSVESGSTSLAKINSRQASPGTASSTASSTRRVLEQPQVISTKEQLTGRFDGFRLILIGDLHELPILHLSTRQFEVVVKDWSADLRASTSIATSITFWNISNSHWEPLIDPWAFSVTAGRQGPSGGITTTFSSKERLDVNISMSFVELLLSLLDAWSKEGEYVLRKARGGDAPYRIRNRTGGSVQVWSDMDGSSSKVSPAVKVASGETIDWRFDDWKTLREHVSSTGHNSLAVQFIGKPWELRNIPVDRAGEYTYTLRPKTQKVSTRLLCDITVKKNVKIVTLRSTFKVQNSTLYPLELVLLDNAGHPAYAVEKIAPGEDYALPIDAVTETRITLRPDQGFGYKWSPPMQWEDFIARPSQVVVCPHAQPNEPAWRLQAWAQYDLNDPVTRKYPKINLLLRAPIELENLLPYNIQYRIFDKNLGQNWSSYLRQGGLMPVHSVELLHLVMLSINVQDNCFKPSDWAIINAGANAELDIERQVSLCDPGERKLELRLNYVRHADSGGAFKVQIYSPYVVMNKTGLPFQLRSLRSTRAGVPQEVAGERRPAELAKPTAFLLSHAHPKGHEFVLKVGDSAWSQTLSFEAPSAEMALSLAAPKDTESHIGVSWTEGQGKYKLSKVITLTPRFLVKNKLGQPLHFREKGMPPSERSLLQPGERSALQYTRRGREKLLTVAYSGLNARWSAPINIQDIGSIHFRLFPPGEATREPSLIRADVAIEGASVHVILNEEAGPWPFVIDNNSDYDISFCQVDEHRMEPKADASGLYVMHKVDRHSCSNYAWDYPSSREKRLLFNINGKDRKVDIMEIGSLLPFKFPSERGSRTVSLDIRAEGLTQTLDISNYEEATSLYKPTRQSTLSRQDTSSSSSGQEGYEAVTEEEVPSLNISLNLAGLGVSLIDHKMVEVVYISLSGLGLEYTRTMTAQAVTISCSVVQVDNQLHDAIYPVALQPSPLPTGEKMTTPPPAVQASVIFLNDQGHGVLFVKYASVLLQSLTVRLDEDFLLSLFDMTKLQDISWEDNQPGVLIEHPLDIPDPADTARGQSVYFEVLELQPIKLIVSFMTTQHVNADEKIDTSNPLALILRTFLNFLGNVNDAPFRLNALVFKDLRQTIPDLEQRMLYHYRQEVTRQALRMMGFADFMGNPVGLFENISSGMVDAFYEPWTGVIVHGFSKEFGIGVVKGVSSLIKKSVFGVSDSFSKVTSSLGKGLATATFDSEWDNRRRLAQRRNKPRHVIDGVATGAEAFAASVGSGFEGLVMKPIEGAQSAGASGFFRGVGKGVVGLVAKPAVGFMDLATNLGAGVRNTTTVFDNPARDRVRIPRHISADGVLTPYSAREALGQSWMKDLEQGAYRNEVYVAHLDLPGGDNAVMLTMSRILSFWSTKLRLEWELAFSRVQGISIEDNGILFQEKGGVDRDRFVYISDPGSKAWFFAKVEQVVKTYNARRNLRADR